jgi:uncharacterized protein YjbI with pentapeptide repeats
MANASRAILDKAQLPVANLKRAILSAANLEGAKLTGAILEGARLPMAKLRQADLTRAEGAGAHFWKAVLYEANLTGASLSGAAIEEADLSRAQLPLANLTEARLAKSRFAGADMNQVNLSRACLKGADFSKADLTGARLVEAEMVSTNFGGAKLSHCEFSRALLMNCNLTQAILTESRLDEAVLAGSKQEGIVTSNLALTPFDEAAILVDDLEMVHLMDALLREPRWRDLIARSSLRVALVIGRFPQWRRPHLDAIREELRRSEFAPLAIDLEKPVGPKLRSVIANLAHLARFVIADLAGSRAFAKDLQPFSFTLRDLPVQVVMPDGEEPPDLPGQWALEPCRYRDTEHLVEIFEKEILKPLAQKLAAAQ